MKALIDKYPRLFQGEPSGMGLGLPLGWYGLMDEALAQINALLTDEQAARFRVDQVKEKLGTLRVHLGRLPVLIGREENGWPIYDDEEPDEEMNEVLQRARKLTNVACSQSRYVCLACGAPGSLRGPETGDDAWRLTLCNPCNRIPRDDLTVY